METKATVLLPLVTNGRIHRSQNQRVESNVQLKRSSRRLTAVAFLRVSTKVNYRIMYYYYYYYFMKQPAVQRIQLLTLRGPHHRSLVSTIRVHNAPVSQISTDFDIAGFGWAHMLSQSVSLHQHKRLQLRFRLLNIVPLMYPTFVPLACSELLE